MAAAGEWYFGLVVLLVGCVCLVLFFVLVCLFLFNNWAVKMLLLSTSKTFVLIM